MKFTVLTLFPELFPGPLGTSLLGKGLAEGRWQLETVNIRDFATGVHQAVDDTPYGGGAGMVMRADILGKAIESVQPQPTRWVCLSPRGRLWRQQVSEEYNGEGHIGLICARYEGIDQRIIDHYRMEELSIGDYVLSNGELAAYVVIDTCIRQIFGVLGNASTVAEESFGAGEYRFLLEYPHYTKPRSWNALDVPDVLLSGDHAKIESWRFESAKKLTQERRPELWDNYLMQRIKREE